MNICKIIIFCFIGLVFNSCSSQKEVKKTPFKTEEVYYQGWIGGQEQTGSGINFYLKFKEPISANFLLKKVYFRGKEANFEKRGDALFIAYFYQRPNNPDLIPSENEEPKEVKPLPDFAKNLKPNEAIVEFEQDNKTQVYKIENIKEKELIAYPSARPRN